MDHLLTRKFLLYVYIIWLGLHLSVSYKVKKLKKQDYQYIGVLVMKCCLSLQICQSVWSPQSVESSIQDICLPFLRVAALLQHHMFGSELPQMQTLVSYHNTNGYMHVHL